MALSRVALACHNPQSLALFYQTALGFHRVETGPSRRAARSPGVTEAICLRYGDSEIELLALDPPGRAFPPGQHANSLSFQHFAMITDDIATAHDALRGVAGWRAISTSGPVALPPSSGGATAFKFRDPEGHPLELLQPTNGGGAPRIDHTAIVVASTAASVEFYQRFGLTRRAGSRNHGPEQAALDGLEAPVVDVTRLGDASGTLHLELLCYHPAAPAPPAAAHDVIATRLVFTGELSNEAADPDGHRLEFLE